jgi:hypothetical protein
MDISILFNRSNRHFEFQKRSRLFIRTHNETLSVAAVRVSNPDRSSVGINRRDTAPTPSGSSQIVRGFTDCC